MQIREFLTRVGTQYDRSATMAAPAQVLLRAAAQHLEDHCPPGLFVRASGGQAFPTFTPWIGFFNPDETSSPQEGLYVAYLFSSDLTAVHLSLQQGIESLSESLGRRSARVRLAHDAGAIRQRLPYVPSTAFQSAMRLGGSGFRQRAYEAGNIVCITYPFPNLPQEQTLEEHLALMLSTYADAIVAKRELLLETPGSLLSPGTRDPAGSLSDDPLKGFKPRSHGEYLSVVQSRILVKSRSHELLLERYATWLSLQGLRPSNHEHPLDLVVRGADREYWVEAKIVYSGNAMNAVRAAIGQLFTYRHMLPGNPEGLVALFSEPIGQAFVELLESIGILAIWWDGRWIGSPTAVACSLAQTSNGSSQAR